jgi:hypothetical protein
MAVRLYVCSRHLAPALSAPCCSLIAEHCATTGDVGRPASALAALFPALAPQLAQLQERWWFDPCPDAPNCAEQL